MPTKPYLSVVACSRNDDHGGSLLNRMQVFLDGISELCKHYRLATELVLVEWNPPEDRPLLSQVLLFPRDNQYFTARIIVVPPSLHRKFGNSKNLQLFQMMAKNVGIARARGDFILTTNVDLLFSHGLMRFLSSKSLQRGCYYRADRYDVPCEIPRGNIDYELSYCRTHILRLNKKEATYDLKTGETLWIYPLDSNADLVPHNPLGPTILGLLGLASWYGGYARELWMSKDGTTAFFLARLMARYMLRRNFGRAGRQHSMEVALQRGFRRVIAQLPSRPILKAQLYTNASGDFVLMSRNDWNQLRGYPEFQTYSIHLDSLLLYQAYYSGIREVILPYPIYHMQHTAGWGLIAEQSSLIDKLNSTGIPYVNYPRFLKLVRLLAKSRGDKHFNSTNWGLADQRLEEIRPGAKRIDKISSPTGINENRIN